MFAIIYEGCKCIETWNVRQVEETDIDKDEIYYRMVCNVCGQDILKEKKNKDGMTMVHILTEEEIQGELSANEMYDDEEC